MFVSYWHDPMIVVLIEESLLHDTRVEVFSYLCFRLKDLRVPDADKSIPVMEKAGDSKDWEFSGPALNKAIGQYYAVQHVCSGVAVHVAVHAVKPFL